MPRDNDFARMMVEIRNALLRLYIGRAKLIFLAILCALTLAAGLTIGKFIRDLLHG